MISLEFAIGRDRDIEDPIICSFDRFVAFCFRILCSHNRSIGFPRSAKTPSTTRFSAFTELLSSAGLRKARNSSTLETSDTPSPTELDQICPLPPSTNSSIPRDETGVIRRQKQHRFGNFVGIPHPPHWNSGHNSCREGDACLLEARVRGH